MSPERPDAFLLSHLQVSAFVPDVSWLPPHPQAASAAFVPRRSFSDDLEKRMFSSKETL